MPTLIREPLIHRILPSSPDGGFAMEDYWVWCGSVIRGEDGLYHMFASRWPKKYPFFAGDCLFSEVVRAESPVPQGPYVFKEVVLPRRPGFWDGKMTHNPTICRYGDQYLLFYIGSTFDQEDPEVGHLHTMEHASCRECYSRIQIGMATSDSVLGPWKRREAPVLSPRKNYWDSTVVTNPAPCIDEAGRILLYYRSNTPEGLCIGLARADGIHSEFKRVVDPPVFSAKNTFGIEDPFVWKTENGFSMIAKDMSGDISGERHAGIMAHSRDGVSWTVSDPPKAYSRNVRWTDGRTTTQGCLERPMILFENGEPTHLFAATGDGSGGFDRVTRTWNMVIPLAG